VGLLLRNGTTKPATGVSKDRWSDASGALAQAHHQDAFGNTQAEATDNKVNQPRCDGITGGQMAKSCVRDGLGSR